MQTIDRNELGTESLTLGSRLLYLRTPNFQGSDVKELQTALGALGFSCGGADGTFDAYTEGALRKFQVNMGLEADGIAGVNTYATLRRLHNAWQDKPELDSRSYMGFARAADVLERHAVCLFGTEEFTRKVASYLSNLALATNPRSKMLSADQLSAAPDASMLLTHVVLPQDTTAEGEPRVSLNDSGTLATRVSAAIQMAAEQAGGEAPLRIAVEVEPPAAGADIESAAHHDAISLLDAFCAAFAG